MRAAAPTRRSALLLAAVGALALSACDSQSAARGASQAGATVGQAKAPVTMVEYASPVCSHCAAWDAEVWPKFKAKYVDTGKVRYELREMLTPPNQVAAAGWLLAKCAGPDKYLAVVEQIYRSQPEMARTGDARGVLLRIAQQSGMNQQQFETCVTNEDEQVALYERVEAATKRGVNGTPTFYINDKPFEGDYMALENFDAMIQPLLARKG